MAKNKKLNLKNVAGGLIASGNLPTTIDQADLNKSTIKRVIPNATITTNFW